MDVTAETRLVEERERREIWGRRPSPASPTTSSRRFPTTSPLTTCSPGTPSSPSPEESVLERSGSSTYPAEHTDVSSSTRVKERCPRCEFRGTPDPSSPTCRHEGLGVTPPLPSGCPTRRHPDRGPYLVLDHVEVVGCVVLPRPRERCEHPHKWTHYHRHVLVRHSCHFCVGCKDRRHPLHDPYVVRHDGVTPRNALSERCQGCGHPGERTHTLGHRPVQPSTQLPEPRQSRPLPGEGTHTRVHQCVHSEEELVERCLRRKYRGEVGYVFCNHGPVDVPERFKCRRVLRRHPRTPSPGTTPEESVSPESPETERSETTPTESLWLLSKETTLTTTPVSLWGMGYSCGHYFLEPFQLFPEGCTCTYVS